MVAEGSPSRARVQLYRGKSSVRVPWELFDVSSQIADGMHHASRQICELQLLALSRARQNHGKSHICTICSEQDSSMCREWKGSNVAIQAKLSPLLASVL
jgi:hypothetical protein